MPNAASYALIFDMDGVLIDNTDYQARAFQLLFRDLGLTTNARRLLERLNGMPATKILNMQPLGQRGRNIDNAR